MRISLIPAIPRVSFMPIRSGTHFSIVVSDSETGIPRNIDGNGGPNGEDYLRSIDDPPTDRPLDLLYPWKDFLVRSPLLSWSILARNCVRTFLSVSKRSCDSPRSLIPSTYSEGLKKSLGSSIS